MARNRKSAGYGTDCTVWEQLFGRLTIKSPTGRPIATPNAAILSKFEKKVGCVLPEGYREFIRVLGAGELGGYFRIFAPGYRNSNSGDIEGFHATVREGRDVLIEVYRDAGFVERMIPFADTVGGDIVVWDPKDKAKHDHELGIYVLPDDSDTIVRIARTFFQFVTEVCLGKRFSRIAGDPNWSPPHEFTPFGRQKPFRTSRSVSASNCFGKDNET